MPSEERYDNYSFNYFAIAILSFILVFWTWRYIKLWHKAFFGKYKGICGCVNCKHKAKKLQIETRKPGAWGLGKFLLFLLLWLLFLYLFKITVEGAQVEQAPAFDPYEILEIDRGATDTQIRKAFRTLSLQYHPDKNKEPGAEEKYILISKAHQTLTDPAVKEKWERYGNPDGPQAMVMGIALPSFLVQQDKMYVVLGVYVVFLVIIFPTVAICYWQKQKSLHTNELSTKTMYYFFTELKDKGVSMRFKKLIDVISLSYEYVTQIKVRRSDEDALIKLKPLLPAAEEREVNRNKKKPKPPFVVKHGMLFFAHFSRVRDSLTPQLKEDLDILLRLSHRLLIGVIEITSSLRFLIPTMESVFIAQMITQAVWSESSRMGRNTQLHQLPHFDDELIRKCNSKKWKINTVLQIAKLDAEKKRELLGEDLTERQIRDIETICNDFLPHDVEFTAKAEVDEDDENYGITAGAIVTLKADFERPSKPRVNPNPKVDDEPVDVHCPFFPAQKNEIWWLIIADERTNQILGLKRIASLRDKLEVKIPFPAPRKPGVYTFAVHLLCDSYVGFDKKKQFKINVKKEIDWEKEKASKRKEGEDEDDYSDEISEDEEGEKEKEQKDESESESEED